ncbi:head-tail adaptor protein [Bacillus cereus]|nr:head-tail adaptor protein [Bacillus cereus]PGV94369.1 head-tail adaptor protein [Bacillus cereus]
MNTLKFNKRITIMKEEGYKDEIGQWISEWKPFAKLWSRIFTVSGREYFAAASVQNETTLRFVIRPPNFEISPNEEIEFKGKRYAIESVLNDDFQNRTLTIIAKTSKSR